MICNFLELKKFGMLVCLVLWQKHIQMTEGNKLWGEGRSSMSAIELPGKLFESFFGSDLLDTEEDMGLYQQYTNQIGFSLSFSFK